MEKYDPIRILGEGSFGKVYLMRDKVQRKFVCVKVIKIKNIPKKEREATKIEVDLLRRLHHPNIVRYIDSFLSKNNESLCICMEYCDGGDLASQIKAARRKLFSEEKVLHWFVQITLGLQYMHANKVLHRDLKTQNIFLLGNGRLVLGDLGISKVLEGTMDFAQTCIGTPYYMSPEIFKNKPYSYKSDVWALGCVLYEMTTLDHAFDAQSLNGLAQKIIKGRYPPVHAKYSRHLRDLIASLLSTNPQQRPDLDQILRKPFVKKHIINFFQDIASRPSSSLGEGTMIVRAAAGGGFNGGGAALGSDQNMISFKRQLEELDMAKDIIDALEPNKHAVPSDPLEAKRLAKDQANALRREEDHKKMVEFALEKLRKERETRMKQVVSSSNPPVSGAGAALLAQRALSKDGKQPSAVPSAKPTKSAASRQPQRQVSQNPLSNPGAADFIAVAAPKKEIMVREGGGLGGPRSRRGGDNVSGNGNGVKDIPESKVGRSSSSVSDDKIRRDQDVRERLEEKKRDDVRAEAKAREDARQREEVHAREDAAAKVRRDQLRAQQQQQEVALKREQNRDKERERQREEIEQLKRDKQELDRRTKERDRLREERRDEERKKLEDERERERRSESTTDDNISNGSKEYEGLSARERVLMRKQERLRREEEERLEALRAAENQNRFVREQAVEKQIRQFHPNFASPPPVTGSGSGGGGGGGGGPSSSRSGEDDNGGGAKKSRGDSSVNRQQMELGELNDRLREVADGASTGAALNSARSNNSNANHDPYSARLSELDPDDYQSDGSSASEGEESAVWDQGAGNITEEEEDMRRKELELQAELHVATKRCEELKHTLQETKTFLDAKGVSFRKVNNNNNNATKGKGGATAIPPVATIVSNADDDDEDDDEFDDYDESGDDDSDDNGESDSASQPPQSSRVTSPPPINVSKQSPYHNLSDPPSPSGRLGDRIQRLRERCKDALGREGFERAYMYLKLRSDGNSDDRGLYEDDDEEEKTAKIREILGTGKAHFMPLIEQLIFMEETHAS
eukprot:gene8586-17713_t